MGNLNVNVPMQPGPELPAMPNGRIWKLSEERYCQSIYTFKFSKQYLSDTI